MVVLAGGVVLLAGCSGGGGGTSAGSTPPSTSMTTPMATSLPASSATPAAAPSGPATPPVSSTRGAGSGTAGAGCDPDSTGIPAGAVSGPAVDVDGDGRADSAWLQRNADGSQLVGITTARGATFGALYRSGSPIDRKVLVADVNGAGTIAVIVSDGRRASLFTVAGCSLVPVRNAQGAQYSFDLGFGDAGTGIGCSGVTGRPGVGLVGLKLNRDAAGRPTTVVRTAIVLDGASASNGVSDTIDVSGDPTGPAVTTATEITCGDLTMMANGVG
jgi:hypothetical protein